MAQCASRGIKGDGLGYVVLSELIALLGETMLKFDFPGLLRIHGQ